MSAPRLESKIDTGSEEYRTRAEHNRALAEKLHADVAEAAKGGIEKHRTRHVERGKLLPRDRVERLLDPGSPFLEIGQLAACDMYEGEVPGAGMIAGIGRVSGRQVMIVCNDATVKGGTYYPMTVKKHLRAQEIAQESRLPCVYLVDSGGANLPHQAEVFPDRDHFGRIFFNQAQMSAKGIPQIACVMGSCTAGGAYVPAMSDESVIVKEQGTIFLGGPPLVKAATGEEISAEELGGGDLHARKSGVVDHLADNDEHALTIVRDIVSTLQPGSGAGLELREPRPPAFEPEELYGIVPEDVRAPYDVHEVIARIVDASEFHEFKPLYGSTLVCGFAHIWGMPVAILANNGILFSESAMKGAHFIELAASGGFPCCSCRTSRASWSAENMRRKASPSMAPSWSPPSPPPRCRRSPLLIGGSFGAGNYGMAGRAYSPRFLFTWPNSRISVMGGEQAASVLATVHRDADKWSEKQAEAFKAPIRERYEARAIPGTRPRGCGTTASSTPPRPATCSAWRSPPASTRRSRSARASACSGCDDARLSYRRVLKSLLIANRGEISPAG
jgi:3-methylcrotonyl-CoA carboxylase beta subunit